MSSQSIKQVLRTAATIGVFALSLSSIPGLDFQTAGAHRAGEGTTDLSSEIAACDIENKLSDSDSASCELGKITGNVKITKSPAQTKKVRNEEGVLVDTDPQDMMKVEVIAGPADCIECAIRKEALYAKTKDIAKLAAELFTKTTKLAVEAQLKAEKERKENAEREKKLAGKRERCEVDETEGDKEITDLSARLECRMRKVSELEPEKAARYFDDNIHGELQTLIESNRRGDRVLAEKLIKKLQGNRNQFIKESANDLFMYGQYYTNSESLALRLRANPNDAQARQGLVQLRSQWAGYFQQRGIAVQRIQNKWTDFNIGTELGFNLEEYQTHLNQSYGQVLERYQNFASSTLGNNPNASNSPRLLRGNPSTSYVGGPASNRGLPNQMPLDQRLPGGSVPFDTQSAQNGRYTKPMPGTPVR